MTGGGYRGNLFENVKKTFGWVLEIVLKSDVAKKFTVLPKRWIVERTFSWFESFRRLSKGYEVLPETSQTMILSNDTNYAKQSQMINSKQFLNFRIKVIHLQTLYNKILSN